MDTADGERKVLDNTTPLKKKDLQNPEIVRKVQEIGKTGEPVTEDEVRDAQGEGEKANADASKPPEDADQK